MYFWGWREENSERGEFTTTDDNKKVVPNATKP
jgi:hypothetical protein